MLQMLAPAVHKASTSEVSDAQITPAMESIVAEAMRSQASPRGFGGAFVACLSLVLSISNVQYEVGV